MTEKIERLELTIRGRVQGVGFRPFVWRLATGEGLTGSVANTSAGVCVEIQGSASQLASFERRLWEELPPLAQITELERKTLPQDPQLSRFVIGESAGHAGQAILVSPDIGVCGDCLADVRDPANPRYAYPFANCTNCGPRFTITRELPYDRAKTTMACFALCDACVAEYNDPANRRFHAQPVACSRCGPRAWLVDKEDIAAGRTGMDWHSGQDAIASAGRLLLDGGIVAIRGLGGFQLACDARDREAVARLRRRKRRPDKALAVMARNIGECRDFCSPNEEQEALLLSAARPIVLCQKAGSRPLAENIAPDTATVGVMLPATPMHALLLDWLHDHGLPNPVLVMTSANMSDEPICLGNREAIDRLAGIADAWLLHNRDILCRVDDSVISVTPAGPVFLRRARGYVPEPVNLRSSGPCVFGAGAELKGAFCITRSNQAFLSQHIGDLETPAHMEFYESAFAHMLRLLEVTPQVVVADLHPDFLSRAFAADLAARLSIPFHTLQHHAAHAAACLGEHDCYETALALCLDGTGYGADGTIWGGELLLVNLAKPQWRRVGSFRPFALPGGNQAIREPWRIAAALAWQNNPDQKPGDRQTAIIHAMLAKSVNCPQTSSCGRLFDAVAAKLGLCRQITYEGQAALRLEKAAQEWLARHPDGQPPEISGPFRRAADDLSLLDSGKLFAKIMEMSDNGLPAGAIAAAFHRTLARELAAMANEIASVRQIRHVALCGGVMNNSLLTGLLRENLIAYGLLPLLPRLAPPGDGGIALGQAIWGAQLLQRESSV